MATTLKGGSVKGAKKKSGVISNVVPWGHLQVNPIGTAKKALKSKGFKSTAPLAKSGRKHKKK